MTTGSVAPVPLSAWDDRTAPGAPETDGAVDPRVARTQRHVLEIARELLLEQGPAALTFSTLATRARVARQTLYRYWPSPEALVADLIRRRCLLPAEPATDARDALRGYLAGMRESFTDPAMSAAFGMLMAAARHVPAAAEALHEVNATRQQWLNERLEGLRAPLDDDDFCRLNGPFLSAHFVGCREISDELIERVVDSFC